MSKDVIIWGASRHARVVADILRLTGYTIVGFMDDMNPQRRGESFFGSTILGGREEIDGLLARGVRRAIVGFGDNAKRLETGRWLESCGFELITAIHPTAMLAEGVPIGPGSVICKMGMVGVCASIGHSTIINTLGDADHDSIMEDGAHISGGVFLAGGASVGRCAFLGVGAILIEDRHVGANSIVGAGAVVTKDVPENVVVAGVPARVIRKIEPAK